ncbi:Pycsar system effector family protein [Neolewinella persica]|uniref:Pycsar system effector family protein n=1 Tax=Neolewinella persica TaxID=70998 RepID=UPI00037E8513|nr:Pycsar system effector family protein [Neolewinella persica]
MDKLVSRVEQFVTDLLDNELPEVFTYHNLEHTTGVVEGAIKIGRSENLTDQEMAILLVAAWFHDTGFVHFKEEHEEESVRIATAFLKKEHNEDGFIDKVGACILATKSDFQPKNKLHQIIRDADMFHLAKDNYEVLLENLRKEWSALYDKNFSDLEWNQLNLDFLSSHRFYTPGAIALLSDGKEKIEKKIRKRIKKSEKAVDSVLLNEMGITSEDLKALKKKLQKAEGKPEKGIETMFRLTSKNHIDISGMADSKANIMISVNSIIISVLLGSLMQKLDSNPHLIPPTIILLMVTLSSIVFSVLSLRPNITSGKFKREDIENQNTNLLFFGNFHKMKREDYHWGMNRLMENASFLYSSLIDDIFFLGVVLAKKYNYLRIAYNIFMFGITIAVIAFVVAILFFETNIN